MPILTPKVHYNCFNYEKDNPLINLINKKEGDVMEIQTKENSFIIVLKGSLNISYGMIKDALIRENEIGLVPFKNKLTMEFLEDTSIMILRLRMKLTFCDHFPLENFFDMKKKFDHSKVKLLKVEEVVHNYINSTVYYINDELKCSFFQELKVKELLYVLRCYYPYEDLQEFFHPIVSKDLMFAEQVYHYSQQTKSIKELSEYLNYSISGFEKRFKTVFGMPAKKWIQQEKAKKIYHEINCSTKPIVEIGFDFGFTSASHFNDYCKKLFNESPGKIRKANLSL